MIWRVERIAVIVLKYERNVMCECNVAIGKSSNEELGNSLIFNKGNDSSLKIDSFINTGKNPYSFSLWYKTEEISEKNHTAILQQGEAGKSLLTLRLDNKYGSYVNGTDVLSTNTVTKGIWQNVIITTDPKSNKVKRTSFPYWACR